MHALRRSARRKGEKIWLQKEESLSIGCMLSFFHGVTDAGKELQLAEEYANFVFSDSVNRDSPRLPWLLNSTRVRNR